MKFIILPEVKECLANKAITEDELVCLFMWKQSPQGFDYWADQRKQLREGLPPSDEFWLELEKVIKQAEEEEKALSNE